LIVNPRASSTTQLRRDVIAHALASQADLEVVETRYRGHAATLAAAAVADGHGVLFTLGGDGTVNETVNGIVRARPAGGEANGQLPALAPLPGGNANVFTRALGLPADPVDATGQIIDALRTGRHRAIGLGLAGDRYFIVNAGLGFDAEVVRAIEGLRARGRVATPTLYVRMTVRQFYCGTDRRRPALTLERTDSRRPTCSSVSFPTPHRGPTWAGARSTRARPPASIPASTCSPSGRPARLAC